MEYKATGYLIAPVRGADGEDVSADVKLANVRFGIELGRSIRLAIPSLDLFIPHEHEEIIDMMWRQGLSSDIILDACCEIAASKDIGLLYDGHLISDGMQREWDRRSMAGMETIVFDSFDDIVKAEIILAMSRI